jgi:RNA polymerase sigma factor (sigma-70 family)
MRDDGEADGADTPPLDVAYRAHWRDLCGYVRRNFGPGPPDPEDVAQQAFLKLSGVSGAVENVGAFLRRTARNLVIDHHRASLRFGAVARNVSILEEGRDDFSAEDVLSSREELDAMNGVIAMLPPKERVALLMHRVDGLSFADIARELRISHSGARLLVSRAFERCARALEARQ